MRYTLAMEVSAMWRTCVLCVPGLLLLVGAACADPPFPSTATDPTAYSFDVTETFNPVTGNWEYTYTVQFLGGEVPEDGSTKVRARAFVIYDVDTVTVLDAYSGDGAAGWTSTSNGASVLWEFSTSGNPSGDVLYPDDVATFTIVTNQQLPTTALTAMHILWVDPYGNDQSAWVNNTPELPPSLLSMIGFGALAFLRRRRK